jgi:hypothetical protein
MENNTTTREGSCCYKKDEEERDKDRRKALLTTPEDASVLKRFVVPQEGAHQVCMGKPELERFFF